MIKAILFDFGGVIAGEGFREGLRAIGRKNGLDPDEFFSVATELVYTTGYVTGRADEATYWNTLRDRTGIKGGDDELREELLSRFVMRPDVIGTVIQLKEEGFSVSILSDQTNWLDEINERHDLFRHFDNVFNSYHLQRSKRDPSLFPHICKAVGFDPAEVLLVDDNPGNAERAREAGLLAIVFENHEQFRELFLEMTK